MIPTSFIRKSQLKPNAQNTLVARANIQKLLDHTQLVLLYNTFFYGVQLSEHFTSKLPFLLEFFTATTN